MTEKIDNFLTFSSNIYIHYSKKRFDQKIVGKYYYFQFLLLKTPFFTQYSPLPRLSRDWNWGLELKDSRKSIK